MRKEAAQEWRIIMKILMLDASTYGEDVNIDKFYALGEVKSYSTSTREEALKRVAEHNPDVVIINKIAADKEFIDAAPALKMIAETATGYNNIDIMYAKEKNIRVANVAGYSTDSVVQHTFALGLYLIEKMSYYDGYVKSGEYAKCPIFSHFSNVFHELTGKTWGIVGLGTIGKGVAKIAADFGCKVIYYSASGKTQDVPYEREEFDEFLKKSDIISIHAPLNDKTNNLFNKEAFDKKGLIYGMGHAVYTNSDQREVILKSFAKNLSVEKGMEKEYALYETVEKEAGQLIMNKRKMFKPVCANVDFYSGFVYTMLGIPIELFTPIFAIARIAGWSAHRIEELVNAGKIIRPAYKYVATHREYLPMEDR